MNTVVAKIQNEKYKVEITSLSGNSIIADEPFELEGNDLGLNPKELLNASLAACTNITLKMYVNHKGWDVSSINSTVELLEDKENNQIKIRRSISFEGNLDEQQIKRLTSVANACPIHKLLSLPLAIETILQES